jgi:hypothetical protein
METSTDREVLSAALRSWGRRRHALEAERNPLVEQALEARITIEEIHKSTGLGRSTIDQIRKVAEGRARITLRKGGQR